MSEIRSQATPARDETKREMLTRLGMIHLAERYGTRLRLEPSHDNEIRVDITLSGGTESHFPDALDLLESVEAVVEHMGLRKPRTVNDVDQLEALPAGTVLRNDKSGRQPGTYKTECVRAEQEGEVRFKVRKEVHKAFGPVWCVSRPDEIQDYISPTWESAMWLACDMARHESESRCCTE